MITRRDLRVGGIVKIISYWKIIKIEDKIVLFHDGGKFNIELLLQKINDNTYKYISSAPFNYYERLVKLFI